MDPIALLALLNASLDIVERAGPILADLRARGVITPEQQSTLLARVQRWRTETFDAPEWKIVP